MTGYEVYNKANLRLGYYAATDTTAFESKLLSRALELINQIATDLGIEALENLSQEINCSEAKAEALCSGMTMLLALSEGDSEKNKIFTDIYNAKRSKALSKTSLIEDTLPVTDAGGD